MMNSFGKTLIPAGEGCPFLGKRPLIGAEEVGAPIFDCLFEFVQECVYGCPFFPAVQHLLDARFTSVDGGLNEADLLRALGGTELPQDPLAVDHFNAGQFGDYPIHDTGGHKPQLEADPGVLQAVLSEHPRQGIHHRALIVVR